MRNFVMFLVLISLMNCSLALNIKTGDMAYELKHYKKAAELYEEEYEKAVNIDQQYYLANRAAKSYEAINDLSKALDWFAIAYQINDTNDGLLNLGKLAMANDSIKAAKAIFKKLHRLTSDQNYLNQVGYLDNLNYDKTNYDIRVSPYSSTDSDFSPVKFESNYVLFSSDREGGSDMINTYNGRINSSLYLVNSRTSNPFLFDYPINSEYADAVACFNNTYDQIYFTRCVEMDERDSHCRIYQSKRVLGQWREPQPILFFTEEVNVGHPAYLDADSVLIFSANPDGNHQLYFSRQVGSTWSLPELMPSDISGPYNEKFPTIDEDTLYFSSDRFPGYGKLDIYKTYVNSEGYWEKPVLLDPPYNSGADDFGLLKVQSEPIGRVLSKTLVSSNRAGGKGLDDIWDIDELLVEESIDTIATDTRDYTVYLSVSTRDEQTKEALPANIAMTKEGSVFLTNTSDTKGRYIKEMDVSGSIEIQVTKQGYFTQVVALSLPDAEKLDRDTTINRTVYLNQIEVGKEIVLDDIYYDFDKWDIRDDAKPSLNQLGRLLKENPTIVIELGSHTDCRGDDDYNLQLSEKRAASATSYLTDIGISSSRLLSKGYGESSPTENCSCDDCEEEEHQTNRRTSFKVITL